MVLPSGGHPATEARLYYQCGGIALDGAGNLFIAAYYGGAVYKVSPDGIITTVASGHFTSVAVDPDGNLYISNSDGDWGISGGEERILKLAPGGTLTSIAGRGSLGFTGDGGLALEAQLFGPAGLAVDRSGKRLLR